MNTKIQLLADNIQQVIIGKDKVIIKLITALLAGGHVLIEDVPGVGKTQLVAALSKSVSGKYNRIQFTPDLMPSDIMGYTMINSQTKQEEYREGSAVCNFLLADEINRASPKAQSSLLEIMEELQISIDGKTHPLPVPFMALATQNPVETYGTYHLPEAQMDRFIMKLSMGYPSENDELAILNRVDNNQAPNPVDNLQPVLSLEDVINLKQQAAAVKVTPAVKQYIINIVNSTRNSEYVTLGASPRGSIALLKTSKALALIKGREFVTPDDVRDLAVDVIAHRLMLSSKGKSVFGTQENTAAQLISAVNVPVAKD